MNTEIKKYEQVTGLIILLVITIICLTIFLKITEKNFFKKTLSFSVTLATGLDFELNDIVKVNGLKAGVITGIKLQKDRSVKLSVKVRQYAEFIRKDSTVNVYPPFMLKKAYLNITPGTKTSPPVKSGDTLTKTKIHPTITQALNEFSGEIQTTSKLLNETLKNLKNGLHNIVKLTDSILDKNSSIGSLLNDDKTMYDSMRNLMKSSVNLLKKLEKSGNNMEEVSKNIPLFFAAARKVLRRTGESLEDLKNLKKKIIDPSLDFPKLYKQIQGIFQQIEKASQHFPTLTRDSSTALKKLNSTFTNFDSISNELEVVSKSLGSILKKIDHGKGSVGKFINDNEVYHDIKSASRDIKEVMKDINKTDTYVGLNSIWYPDQDYNRYEIYLDIFPSENRNFTLGFSYLMKEGPNPAFQSVDDTEDNLLRPTIELAQRWARNPNFNIRVGVIEGRPGIGINYQPKHRKSAVIFELRDSFTKDDTYMARLYWRYKINNNLNVMIGGNDLLDNRGIMFGMNYNYKDEDITKIIRIFGTGR